MTKPPFPDRPARQGRGALNAAISFIGLSSQQISAFAITLLAAGVLGAAEYGVYTLAVVFVEFVVMMTYTGFFHFVVNSDEDEGRVLSTMFWIMVGIGALGGVLMLLFAQPLADLFDAPDLAPVLRAFGLLQPFASAIGWATAVLTREGRMRPYFLSLGGSNFGAMLGGGLALVIWPSVYSLVIFRTIRIALGLILFGVSVGKLPRLVFDRKLAVEATRYATGLYGARLLTFFANFGTDLILAWLFSTAEAGLYRFANRIATATLDLVAQPLRSFSLKSFGQKARMGEPIRDVFSLYFGMSVLLNGGVAITLMIIGPTAVTALFQPEYAAAIIAMQAMAVRAFARVGQSMIEPVFATQKRTRMAMIFNLSLTAAILGSILLFASQGFSVLAVAQAAVQVASVPVAVWAISRGASIDPRPALGKAARAMGLLTVFACVLGLAWYALGLIGLTAIAKLVCGVLLAMLLGGATVGVAIKMKLMSLHVFAD